MTPAAAPPVPVIVVTGMLGTGKTTAIAAALAAKPATERWVVILNEFTDTGIDVLTVAASAQGEFDVRLVAGGCLCCAGAEDFTRTFAALLAGPRPARVYIEPSGLGEPAAIIAELLAYEARGDVRLEAVVALVDAARLADLEPPGTPREQVEAADVVLLAQADRATPADAARFRDYALGLYPTRRLVGECHHGRLPAALGADGSAGARPLPRWRALDDASVPPAPVSGPRAAHRLARASAAFCFPRSVAFDEDRLLAAVGGAGQLAAVERLKGVFRVGPDRWCLVQRAAGRVTVRESPWRRDSRVELVAAHGARLDEPALDAFWATLQAGAPPPRDPQPGRGADRR